MKNPVEPQLQIGVLKSAERVTFDLQGGFELSDTRKLPPGRYEAIVEPSGSGRPDMIRVTNSNFDVLSPEFLAASTDTGETRFGVSDVTIGIGFHWQQTERQEFKGNIKLVPGAENQLVVINQIGLESYLESVVSSEMSDQAHPEFLKAHAVVSRSWVLAQIDRKISEGQQRNGNAEKPIDIDGRNIWRWYDRENHSNFDLCADDHCQRYQGVTKATTMNASQAVQATRGQVLLYAGGVCDTRYSKSCGGMTEEFASAWEDVSVPYLSALFDGPEVPSGFDLPLSTEKNVRAWIDGSPPAFCNSHDQAVLDRILPDFDRATSDFYRWKIEIGQDELQQILLDKLGTAAQLGDIKALVPVQRGSSGRIIKLRIEGTAGVLEIGKELEIRRALSKSHLYSSAFVVDTVGKAGNIPERFILTGAGWGHGVGLCQIGAAVMADRGYRFSEILEHYFQSAVLHRVYD